MISAATYFFCGALVAIVVLFLMTVFLDVTAAFRRRSLIDFVVKPCALALLAALHHIIVQEMHRCNWKSTSYMQLIGDAYEDAYERRGWKKDGCRSYRLGQEALAIISGICAIDNAYEIRLRAVLESYERLRKERRI